MVRKFSVMVSAPGNESAHAVGDDHQFYLPGQLVGKCFKEIGKFSAVFRNVKSGIIMDINRHESQVSGQGRAMIVLLPVPLQIIHA